MSAEKPVIELIIVLARRRYLLFGQQCHCGKPDELSKVSLAMISWPYADKWCQSDENHSSLMTIPGPSG